MAKNYAYDVFLSFTGADREMKNGIRCFLEENGLKCYDSDLYCKGNFRADFCEALDQSRVYLMLLTDNLKNDPMISERGCLTEVRRECSLACQLEAANELNIVILCMSEFFRFDRPFHDYNDVIGWHFYSHTRGFSQIYGQKDEEGLLQPKTLNEIMEQCRSFVEKRNAGDPMLSQMAKVDIATEKLINDDVFQGREEEIEAALKAFSSGTQTVILQGKGGFGKTSLAVEIAKRCEEMGYLKCPQVVYVPDQVGEATGIASVISSVTYVDSVYDSLSTLSAKERYERKLGALRGLPETVLLVIDNFNTMTEEDIKLLQSKLNCRILITTRATINERENTKVIPVESLSEQIAYNVFCEISRNQVREEDFRALYTIVGGHTITLCIMAKMMAVHKMGISEILDELGKDDETDAKVDFVHNDHSTPNTVLGHLKTLFNISNLSERATDILRSMSLLSDGTIAVEELVQALSLKNRNEIEELVQNGWLDRQDRETADEKSEYLYLHPVLSLLMANLLVPTESNTADMVAYIIRKTDAEKRHLSYANVTALENKLFYACYVLAGGCRKLSKELWSRFVDVNHLLVNAEETAKKVHQLATRIENENEKLIVTTYGDMVTLEQFPTRTELLDKYIHSLESNAEDYKWVMRSLSVMMAHVGRVPKYKPFLENAIDKAFEASMKYDDHFALLDLAIYSIVVSGKEAGILKKLKNYVNTRKKMGDERDSLLYLEFWYDYFSLLTSKEMKEFYTVASNIINDVYSDRYGYLFKKILRHPILWHRVNRIMGKIKDLETNDPVLVSFQMLYGEGIRVVDDGYLDMETVIQAAINLHMYRLESQHTLASACDSIAGVIGLLTAFPDSAVKKYAGSLVEMIDVNNITVKELSDLQVAVVINRMYGNREAIEQGRQLIDVVRRLRSDEHNDVIYALSSYGDICQAFGEYKNALSAYTEAYKLLVTHAPDSADVQNLAQRILRLPTFSKEYELSVIKEIAASAIAGKSDTTVEYYEIFVSYLIRLLEKGKNSDDGYDQPQIEEIVRVFLNCPVKMRKMGQLAQGTCIHNMHEAASVLANHKMYEKAEEIIKAIARCKRSKHPATKIRAQIYYWETLGYIHFKKKEREQAEMNFRKAVSLCVKKHKQLNIACVATWLMIVQMDQKYNLEQIFAALVKDPKQLHRLHYYASKWYSDSRRKEDAGWQYLKLLINIRGDRIAFKEMNISGKEFKNIRTDEDFYALALEKLILSV